MTSGELAELCERFLAACQYAKSLSPNTLAAYRQDLALFRVFRDHQRVFSILVCECVQGLKFPRTVDERSFEQFIIPGYVMTMPNCPLRMNNHLMHKIKG